MKDVFENYVLGPMYRRTPFWSKDVFGRTTRFGGRRFGVRRRFEEDIVLV